MNYNDEDDSKDETVVGNTLSWFLDEMSSNMDEVVKVSIPDKNMYSAAA